MMAAPQTYPCDGWADTYDLELCPDCGPDAEIDPTIRDRALTTANRIVYVLSGRKYPGSCTETVRPCTCPCNRTEDRSRCACGDFDQITLDHYPITSVSEIRVDGAALSSASWRIDDFKYVVRIDGDSWPCCQDLTADPASENDTFQIAYTWGVTPGEDGKMAAARLACELAKAYSGRDCQLPERITSISRQGIDIAFIDPQEFLSEGRTGIYLTDAWIKAENPSGVLVPPAVFSPDVSQAARRVDT